MGRKVSLLLIVVLVLFITSCNHGEGLRSIISKISNDGIVEDNISGVPFNRDVKVLEQDFELDEIKEENVNVGQGDIIFEVQNRKKDEIDFNELPSLENFDNEFKNLQWWCGYNEKTLANLYKMSFAARNMVSKFYDIWAKSNEEYDRVDKTLDQAISDLDQIKNSVTVEDNKGKNDRIFEAKKKLDIAIDLWKEAREVKQKAEKDCRIADYYSRKIETTIEVLLGSLKLMEGGEFEEKEEIQIME
ncbi:hypothetical protein bpSLO_001291 (plasmid) [Borrelia parkeri]|uniref:hypothetical protein n=1 Tax=Borrelia parkeri TaxID=141 RepID=UPI001FF50092|nr:hypothetical protein [Borrelia parkeri]UPA11438.1 hypothetical protein bpSLO_001291 [Borrelia parkeri]